MSKFHKNAVITGHFDLFCLLCEAHLKQNADEHIEIPDHKAKLQQSSYVPKYESHHIRKVTKGYYCEFCNILVPTLAKIGLHVSTKDHLKLKGNQLLKEVEEGIIVFDELLIGKKAWNGLIDDTCLLCNEEFIDENEHVKESSHILKLIQSEVELRSCGNIIYRNVDASILHCLICNIVIGLKVMETHFESNDHFKKIRECCDGKKNLDKKHSMEKNNNENIKTDMNGNDLSNNDNSDKPKPQAETKNSAKSVKKAETKSIERDIKNSEVKSEENGKDCKIKGNKEMLHPFAAIEEAKVLAKENQIIYKLGKQSAFCKVCNVTISSSIKRMKEHIEESLHRDNLNTKKNVSKNTEKQIHVTKVTMHQFIYNARSFETLRDDFPRFIIINKEICISYLSFFMMTVNDSVIRCQACQEKVSPLEIQRHLESIRHMKAMIVTPVVASLKTEFVREVRPDLYHCGFCNLIAGKWQDLSLHLMSETHAVKKCQLALQGFSLRNV